MSTDFIELGSIGYAQLGTSNYYATKEVEKKVLGEFIKTEQFAIPEEFDGMCWFGIKRFPYEYDAYYEAVLYYYEDVFEDFKKKKKKRFWEFVNTVESIDFETPELLDKCRKQFVIDYPLQITHKKKPGQDDDNLKIA